MNITVLCIDLAKTIFQLHGIDTMGKAVLKKATNACKVGRVHNALTVLLNWGMEACSSSHYWARKFQQGGREVK
jgi:transposase